MKLRFTLFFTLFVIVIGWSQPPNDECTGAQQLSLSTPPACPSTAGVTNTFNTNNNNATPTSPYPEFSACDVGGSTDAPASEVWYRFTATSNIIDISITGQLNTPNIVLFTGSNCSFLTPVYCASAPLNAGSLAVSINVLQGQTYFLFVSGGTVDDTGNFTLAITSRRDCSPCLLGNVFSASPPPLNGTYNSGQEVNFCFTIDQWDVTSTIEWLHAIELNIGPGWDITSLSPNPPPSCDGQGQWGFYNSWVGSNTGMVFGPGFAYDSSLGGPFDGNPGNNWGDGGSNGGINCSLIGTSAPAVTFCWTITVADCPPNSTGNNLNMSVQVWSDGDSGSWTQTGCNSGTTFDFFATAVCCNDNPPIVVPTNTSCPGASNGSITASGGSTPGTVYNWNVFNSTGGIVYSCDACPGPISVNNLPAGTYSVLATNIQANCSRSTPAVIAPGTPPTASVSLVEQPCPGETIQLQGMASPGGPGTTYAWTGPGGFTSNQQNPTNALLAGTYSLVVTTNGCPSAPASINVNFITVNINATANPATVCQGGMVTLTANGAQTYNWVNTTTGQLVGSGAGITVTMQQSSVFTVTGIDVNGCTGMDDVAVTVNPPPVISVSTSGSLCAGEPVVLIATGANTYVWADNPGAPNPRTVTLPAGSYTYNVTGTTTATGCSAPGSVSFIVAPAVNAAITPSNPTICGGSSITLTGTGGITYNWSTGQNNVNPITVSPNATTNYIVTVTNEDGCTDIASVTVNVTPPLPAPAISCGNITPNSVQFVWPAVPGASVYDVVVGTGQIGTLAGTTYTVSNLLPGETVTITVTAQSGGACPGSASTFSCTSQNCPPVGVDALPLDPFCLSPTLQPDTLFVTVTGGSGNGTVSWNGPGVLNTPFLDFFDPLIAGEGTHAIVASYVEGQCTYTDTLFATVYPIPTADFTQDTGLVCIDQSVIFTYTGDADTTAAYNWNFDGGNAMPGAGQGPQTVSWDASGIQTITLVVEANGCFSDTAALVVTVEGPLQLPVINCAGATTTSATFDWNDVAGATGYTVAVLSGQTGTQTGNSFMVNNIQPGEAVTIEVTAQTDNACGPVSAQTTCNAADCPGFTINISPVSDVCLNGANTPLTLTANVSGGQGNGTRTWSGPGIVDAANGVFDPAVAGSGVYTLTLTYAEGPCSETASITVDVFDTPTADFTLNQDTVCVNEIIVASYTGSANSANATFNWNFNGGTANPGTGPGPQSVSWPTSGTKIINLVVAENGCTSQSFSQTIQVDEPLLPPVINCATTTSQIIFSWADVNNATGYNVTVLTGQSGTQNGNTYNVTGLSPGDVVTLEVEAISGNACINSVAQQTCIAEDCAAVNLAIDNVTPICLDASAAPITIGVQITGGVGNGTRTWSGPGITDAANGVFDPDVAGPGTHVILLAYQEGNCNYNSSTAIVVNAQPVAVFIATPTVCAGEDATITFTGNTDSGASYNWNFGGGTATPGTGIGPHQVNWANAGNPTISLTVVENNCASEAFTASVTVEQPLSAPVISCSGTNTSITVSWPQVAGAADYAIVTNGPAHTINQIDPTTYSLTGLNPGDMVMIEVTANSAGVCPSVSSQTTCTATACPPVVLNITPVAALCNNATPVTLLATATGGAGGGVFTWSGPGVSLQGANFVFNPAQAGVGQHTLTVNYTEGVCDYSGATTVTVNAVPTATFTVVSPVCAGSPSQITFTGSASASATYTWNFSGGSATPGTGVGPHAVTWATAGSQTVSLTVNDNGCTASSSANVQVDAPLATPVVTCQQTTSTSIVFSWAPVSGATGYQVVDVDGPAGMLSGTTYTVTGLTPNQSVTINVIAQGVGACGNSTGTGTCIAQDCPTNVLALNGTTTICSGQTASVSFDFTGSGGSYSVVYTINGGAPVTATLADGAAVSLGALSGTTILQVIEYTNLALPDCTYPGNASWTVTVNQPVNAGTALAPARLCAGSATPVNLAALITGATPGGTWQEISTPPSTGGAFNAGAATFNPATQLPGAYRFVYRVDAVDPCPDAQVEVQVIIEAAPVADAGADQTITCNTTAVSLGGTGTSTGAGITYNWSASDPNIVIADPNNVAINATQGGIYTLTVTNDFGCSDTDEVTVDANLDVPVADLQVTPITCFQANDGVITIENVSGGTGPYSFSLNGGPFTSQTQFAFLGPENYTLVIQDQNGCTSELAADISQPEELVVTLVTSLEGSDRTIELGDSVRLAAVYNSGIQLDTIIWEPDSIAMGNSVAIWVSPGVTTQYTVTIVDVNGCTDSDNTIIVVRKRRPIYIPNAFSPNDDGINDILYIHSRDNQVREVKSFLVFNRWGETMIELRNFQPNNPAFGWDGRHRSRPMNPGVYVYFAEIEFIDGEIVLYKGDVNLLR
ncbi:MAG: gliding motility-associated C-terminal domain-containing protein [Saprospiraceae bacterium]|nr:gliding motility-associated C-terminal domain-containing protein [Saprospiraceae bacterium]